MVTVCSVIRSLSSNGLCILFFQCTASTACMCIYGLLSFVLTSLELHTLGNQQVSVQGSLRLLPNLK